MSFTLEKEVFLTTRRALFSNNGQGQDDCNYGKNKLFS